MNVRLNKVYFYENFGLPDCVVSYLNKKKVFYNFQSLLLRFTLKLLGLVLHEEARKIWYGDLLKNTGIRRSAYERAEMLAKILAEKMNLFS